MYIEPIKYHFAPPLIAGFGVASARSFGLSAVRSTPTPTPTPTVTPTPTPTPSPTPCPPYGTFIYSYCDGFTLYSVYNDGSCGSYTTTETNSVSCGFIPGSPVWTNGGSLISSREGNAGAGSVNSAFSAGGYAPGGGCSVEVYNGSTWSSANNLPWSNGKCGMGGTGTQNAGMVVGGTYSCGKHVFTYDGTNWTTSPEMNTWRSSRPGLTGVQNSALAFGGSPYRISTEEFNGSSWSVSNNMTEWRESRTYGIGSQNAGLAIGGNPSQRCTEEYNGSTWATGGSLTFNAGSSSGAGSQNEGLAYALNNNSDAVCTQKYDGTVWSTQNRSINPHGYGYGSGQAGSQSSALVYGGGQYYLRCTEEFG